ncbi:hypothetical protein, partial [uncultured Dialister sp.]|uniref:hypothetical protein n=1 Tax=uncultured Dialister sp. TaxID=278064 RepID=UPI0025F0AC65
KEPHDEAVHENSYKSKLYELISASLVNQRFPDIIISHDSMHECIIARLAMPLKGGAEVKVLKIDRAMAGGF